jgi:uncharacterized membrane protein YfcA
MKSRKGTAVPKRRKHNWVHNLPFKMKFRASGLYISAIPPLLVGILVGVLAAIMGVGGGFIMVPAMIYLLGMPTKVVVGTSLFQIILTTAFTTMMHATTNYTVDVALAVLLLVGGVVGAQIGTRIGVKMKAEHSPRTSSPISAKTLCRSPPPSSAPKSLSSAQSSAKARHQPTANWKSSSLSKAPHIR